MSQKLKLIYIGFSQTLKGIQMNGKQKRPPIKKTQKILDALSKASMPDQMAAIAQSMTGKRLRYRDLTLI